MALSKIIDASIAAGVDSAKIGAGDVSNAEHAYLNSVSSNVQTQISAAGGAWTFISSVTASDDPTVDFLSSFSSTYDQYMITWHDVVPATDTADFRGKIAQGGVAQGAGQYDHGMTGYMSSGSANNNGGTTNVSVTLTLSGVGSASGEHTSGSIVFYNPLSTSSFKTATYDVGWYTGAAVFVHANGGVSYNSTTATSGFQFIFTSGNVASGVFRLYGLANS